MTEAEWIQVGVAIVGVVGGFVIAMARWVAKSFETLVQSIDQLNINVAVVVDKVNGHERRIERLEEEK